MDILLFMSPPCSNPSFVSWLGRYITLWSATKLQHFHRLLCDRKQTWLMTLLLNDIQLSNLQLMYIMRFNVTLSVCLHIFNVYSRHVQMLKSCCQHRWNLLLLTIQKRTPGQVIINTNIYEHSTIHSCTYFPEMSHWKVGARYIPKFRWILSTVFDYEYHMFCIRSDAYVKNKIQTQKQVLYLKSIWIYYKTYRYNLNMKTCNAKQFNMNTFWPNIP